MRSKSAILCNAKGVGFGANQLLSVCEGRCGSDAVTAIETVLLLGEDHVAEFVTVCHDGLGFLVWLGYDPDGKTPKARWVSRALREKPKKGDDDNYQNDQILTRR